MTNLRTLTVSNQSVNGIANGVSFGQTAYSGADGYYYFLIPPSLAPTTTGGVVTYLTGGPLGNSFSDYNGQAFNLPITMNYLTLQSRTTSLTAMVGTLQTALGGMSGDPNLLFSIASGNILSVNGYNGLDLSTDTGSLNIDQPISVNNLILEGFANTNQTSAISANDLSLLGIGNFGLTNSANAIGTLAAAAARNLPFFQENIARSPFSAHRISLSNSNSRPRTPPTPQNNLCLFPGQPSYRNHRCSHGFVLTH